MKAEEREILKEKLKKQIDELSDEELEKVAGGNWWEEMFNSTTGLTTSPDFPNLCTICKKVFKTKEELEQHKKENH